MGFKLIFAGLVFFFNPCINIFDVLPDFIGCILISAGLYKLADVEDRFFAARQFSNRLIAIYVLKLLLSFYLPARWKSGLLPITFVYAVGEIILVTLLFVNLYGAIEYMANLHDGTKHLKTVGNVSKVAVIFNAAKNILAFIPEAFALEKDPEFDFSYNAVQPQTLSMAKPYVIVFFTLVILIFGAYFIYVNFGLFKNLANDTVFVGNLKEIYTQRVTNNTELINRRKFNRFSVLMIIASVLLCDLIIDAVNFLPNIFAYAVMYAAIACLCDKKQCAKAMAVALPLAVVSLIATICRTVFDSGVNFRMGYESYLASSNALVNSGSAIYIGAILAAAEALLFVLFTATLMRFASEKYTEMTNNTLPVKQTVFASVFYGICSVFSTIAPYIKAMYYNIYINDTLKCAWAMDACNTWELVQGWSNIAKYASVIILVASFVKMRRKADFDIGYGIISE